MSTYTIRPVTNLKSLIDSHVNRGFKVIACGNQWTRVQALAKTYNIPTMKDTAMVSATLARIIHENQSKGQNAFECPTLILVDETGFELDKTTWARVTENAHASDQEIILVLTPAE